MKNLDTSRWQVPKQHIQAPTTSYTQYRHPL